MQKRKREARSQMERSEDRVRNIRETALRAQTEASNQLVELVRGLGEREMERMGTEAEKMIQATQKEMKMLNGNKRKQITNRKQMTRVRKTIEGDIKEAMKKMTGKESEVEKIMRSQYEANVKQRRRSTQESIEIYRGLSELFGAGVAKE